MSNHMDIDSFEGTDFTKCMITSSMRCVGSSWNKNQRSGFGIDLLLANGPSILIVGPGAPLMRLIRKRLRSLCILLFFIK